MIRVQGDAAEVALGEAQAVLALVHDGERRGRLADLVAAVQDGELGEDEAQALEGRDAWVTGMRRADAPTRTDIGLVGWDERRGMVKLNPLAAWTDEDVERYVAEHGVFLNPLRQEGYASIGCAPCTRAIAPGEPTRAGRWWWETDAPKECGMHCSIETGGFEHELHAILGSDAHAEGAH